MATPPQGMPPLAPGQQPTPEQIRMMQAQLAADAAKNGMTVPQFIELIKRKQFEAQQAQAAHMAQQRLAAGGAQPQPGQPGQPPSQQQAAAPAQAQPQAVPIVPGEPKPEALAVANFLKKQDLKQRTCILNGQRKEMFKVKRALRSLQSPEYEKARKKNPLLPKITDRASLENTFKLLPLSLLALRVSKVDEHAGHNHAPPKKDKKRTKGLWTVKIEQQQECKEELHFVWLYEGSQVMQKVYAAAAIAAVFAIVMFPLWPMKMRLGVWYLSMGMLGLIGLFFAMSIFRLILFAVTMFAAPPGLWLYPNLFEDVGFFDSFRPVWGWQEVSSRRLNDLEGTANSNQEKKQGKKAKKTKTSQKSAGAAGIQMPGQPAPATATTTSSAAPQMSTSQPVHRHQAPQVEEVFDE